MDAFDRCTIAAVGDSLDVLWDIKQKKTASTSQLNQHQPTDIVYLPARVFLQQESFHLDPKD